MCIVRKGTEMAFDKMKYDNEYMKEKYHRISLNVKKKEYDRLKHFSEKENLTVRGAKWK